MNPISLLTICLAAASLVAAAEPLKRFDQLGEVDSDEIFDTRVVNGNLAARFQFPWQVTVFVHRPRHTKIFCSGALLSLNTVLTHADCLVKGEPAYVLLGSNTFKSGIRVQVTKTIVHPRNNTRANHHHHYFNIAVLKLAEPVTLSRSIHPIALPPQKYEYYAFQNLLTRFAGFGSNVKSADKKLRWANYRVQTIEHCSTVFPLPTNWNHMILCAESEGGHSHVHPGFGDLGSPLVWRYKNQDYIIGMFALFANETDVSQGPSGFINIAAHSRWIGAVVRENAVTPDAPPAVPPTPPHP